MIYSCTKFRSERTQTHYSRSSYTESKERKNFAPVEYTLKWLPTCPKSLQTALYEYSLEITTFVSHVSSSKSKSLVSFIGESVCIGVNEKTDKESAKKTGQCDNFAWFSRFLSITGAIMRRVEVAQNCSQVWGRS